MLKGIALSDFELTLIAFLAVIVLWRIQHQTIGLLINFYSEIEMFKYNDRQYTLIN